MSETVDTDSDVKALIRRMDVDHDNAISFADFFTRMLPYFIFGETKSPSKSKSQTRSLVNISIPRASTAKVVSLSNTKTQND